MPKIITALILGSLLLFVGFKLGMDYQKSLNNAQTNTSKDFMNNNKDPDPGYMKQMIIVEEPKPYEVITSPLTIKGKARGTWFFEGSFPIALYCGTENKIAEHYASTQQEWMTEEFVDFTATLTFTDKCNTEGILELKKDNPSGLTELDDKVLIPVRFGK